MKKIVFLVQITFLLLLVAGTAWGQYTGSSPNVALSKSALANDSVAGHGPSLAVDNDELTFASIPGIAPAWIEIDLGLFHYVDGYEIARPGITETPLTYTFDGSADGTLWTTLGAGVINSEGTMGADVVSADSFRYVRINMSLKDDPADFPEIRVFGEEISPPYATLALPASDIAAMSFTANWERNDDAEGYAIQIARDAAYTDRLLGYTNYNVGLTLNHSVTGLTPGETYYYRVRTYNYAGTSGFGNSIPVTTLDNTQSITFDELSAVDYGVADFDLLATASSGLTVSFESSDTDIATIAGSTITITGAGTVNITATQEGDDLYLPATPVVQPLTVNTVELSISGAMAENKVYDGQTDAVISGAVLDGIVGNDVVNLTQAITGTFAQAGVGTAIVVSTSMGLGGADAANYTLGQQPTGLQADISSKELSVTGAAAANKTYDGNMDATVSGANLDGVVAGEDVVLENATSGTFAQADAGTGIAVSIAMNLSGADIANYTLTQPTGLQADITPAELTVTAGDAIREECAENPEFTFTYAGFVGSEDASVLDTEPVTSCAADGSSQDGTYDILVSGGSDVNYSFTYENGTLTVNPDLISPVLQVKNITIQLDENNSAEITPADLVVSASDECGIADTLLSKYTFGLSDVGDVSVAVIVKDPSTNSTSEIAVVTVTGPNSVEPGNGIGASIYPNPTHGKLHIELNSAADEMKVMDITGKVIYSKKQLSASEIVDLSEFNNGIYLIYLKSGDEVLNYKVVKK